MHKRTGRHIQAAKVELLAAVESRGNALDDVTAKLVKAFSLLVEAQVALERSRKAAAWRATA